MKLARRKTALFRRQRGDAKRTAAHDKPAEHGDDLARGTRVQGGAHRPNTPKRYSVTT